MELQIQDLITSIKKDGVDAAKAESDAIIAEANKKASDIVAKAKSESAAMISEAQQKIETIRSGALENAKQAQRDAVLSFKSAIAEEYKKLLAVDIKDSLNGEALAKLIKAVIADENPANYTAEVSEVSEGLKAQLAKEISEGLEIKLSSSMKSGFKLASKDGSGYFDCSDEEIAEMLKPYFSNLNF